jgi:5-methylthioribose kinase
VITPFDVEEFDQLRAYLSKRGLITATEKLVCRSLAGGVSNKTVLVERANGQAFVLKQALEKLRVASEWHCDPRRIEREALGLTWLERLAPHGAITPLLFVDAEQHLLGMRAVRQPHENWKTRLLAGRLDRQHVRHFGKMLGLIHKRSQANIELAQAFWDGTFFEALRLEPYYRSTASRLPAAESFLLELIAETLATRTALVHGDYSPKNVLIYQENLVLLDHEVIHFGDPAFDVGFALTHFLSKANHLAEHRVAFVSAAVQFWESYQEAAGEWARAVDFRKRVVRHTLACLLARVEGRSPLEYLTGEQGAAQTSAALSLIPAGLESISSLAPTFAARLG